jgi:hypothetical protein
VVDCLTSLRSSLVGMLHSNNLSSRPGRRRAESIRSGRLEEDEVVSCYQSEQDMEIPRPCSSKDINPIETLRTVHQCQELIHNSIGHPSTVVSTIFLRKAAVSELAR